MTGYRVGDEVGRARHDAWQDWMLMLVRRRLLGAAAPEFSFDIRLSAALHGPLGGTQTVSYNTDTLVLMDSVEWDNGNDIGLPIADLLNSALVIPVGKAGLWWVNAGTGFLSSVGSGYRNHWIAVNGTPMIKSNVALSALGDVERSMSGVLHLEAGDVLTHWVRQQWLTTNSLPLPPTDFYKVTLAAARVGQLP